LITHHNSPTCFVIIHGEDEAAAGACAIFGAPGWPEGLAAIGV
jgi:hypothetical protein